MKFSAGDLVLIIDNYYNVTGDNAVCLILDRVNPFEFLGLPDDVFLDDDPKIKEVYKIFLHGTISLINSDDILEIISERETKNIQ